MYNRRVQWSFRLREELKHAHSACFLTMTYSEENLPWGSYAPTLSKRDVQLFLKRLRKVNAKLSKHPLRYYAVGEYGTNTKRPHYHMLLFNCHPSLYEKFSEVWALGHTEVGDVNDASIHYVTKYHVNYHNDFDAKKKDQDSPGERFQEPEFALMSRKPGIGAGYIGRASKWNYENGYLFVIKDGYKQAMPRYYRKKIFTEEQLKRMAEQSVSEAQVNYWIEYNRLTKLGIEDPDKYMEESLYRDSLKVFKKNTNEKL